MLLFGGLQLEAPKKFLTFGFLEAAITDYAAYGKAP